MKELVLVPTSHISEESIRKIREVIEREKPECVAVELDANRYVAMRNRKASTLETLKALGFMTFLVYTLLRKIQERLGKSVSIMPGSEMIHAVKMAEKAGTRVAFIDRDIRLTFLRIKEGVPRREKAKLIWFMVKGLGFGYVASRIRRKGSVIDLRKVPPKELIDSALELLEKEFPMLYRVLIRERDQFMATSIRALFEHFKKIVAVVGAGHSEGIKKLLNSA